MPTQNIYILKFNQYKISNNVPYINYADLESLILKNRWMCSLNLEKIATTKIGENILVDIQCNYVGI